MSTANSTCALLAHVLYLYNPTARCLSTVTNSIVCVQVLGGSYLGRYVSERTVQYVGGSLFLLFAAATVVDVVRGLQP